jgi:hypothetical protein
MKKPREAGPKYSGPSAARMGHRLLRGNRRAHSASLRTPMSIGLRLGRARRHRRRLLAGRRTRRRAFVDPLRHPETFSC